jgi:large subunit ribosomal protein L29
VASIVELREMSDDQLLKRLEDSREEIFNLRFQHASARLSDVSRIRTVRREVAQLETVLHMRELAIEEAADQEDVAEAINGKDWSAEAHFSYEKSAWEITFSDDDEDEIATALVDLNKKIKKGRRARR